MCCFSGCLNATNIYLVWQSVPQTERKWKLNLLGRTSIGRNAHFSTVVKHWKNMQHLCHGWNTNTQIQIPCALLRGARIHEESRDRREPTDNQDCVLNTMMLLHISTIIMLIDENLKAPQKHCDDVCSVLRHPLHGGQCWTIPDTNHNHRHDHRQNSYYLGNVCLFCLP